jgi:hypothetical protein
MNGNPPSNGVSSSSDCARWDLEALHQLSGGPLACELSFVILAGPARLAVFSMYNDGPFSFGLRYPDHASLCSVRLFRRKVGGKAPGGQDIRAGTGATDKCRRPRPIRRP